MSFNQTLASQEQRDVTERGNFIWCDAGTRVRITVNGNTWTIGKNEGVSVDPFEAFQVQNVSGESDLIQLRAGYGRLIAGGDGQLVSIINAVEIDDSTPPHVVVDDMPPVSVSATVNQSNQVTPLADVTLTAAAATQIAAANSSRKEIMIKNPVANTAAVRIGDATAAANVGFELEPGESLVVTTTAAVYAYSAAAQDMSLTELEFV